MKTYKLRTRPKHIRTRSKRIRTRSKGAAFLTSFGARHAPSGFINGGTPTQILTLEEIQRHATDPNIKYEICGPLINDQHYLEPNPNRRDGRANCSTTRNSNIWHTHPASSKYYPSYEDIRTPLMHSAVQKSVIYTKYGEWILEYDGPIYTRDQVDTIYKDYIESALASFYHKTDKGRTYNAEEIDVLIYILQYPFKNNDTKYYHYKISFIPTP